MANTVKTNLDGLEVGMYVSRLSVPWIETSFLLEGLMIRSNDEIEQLKAVCEYAYIDVNKGKAPHPKFILKSTNRGNASGNKQGYGNSDIPQKKRSKNLSKYNGYDESVSKRRIKNYKNKTSFSDELESASIVHGDLSSDIQVIMSSLNKGKALNFGNIVDGIRDMTKSVIRNPSAMSWVAHIKRMDDYSYSRALGSSVWCAIFGRHLGLEIPTIETLSLGGLLLDIGKTRLPVDFLNLPRKLSKPEMRVMQKHVSFGDSIISDMNTGLVNHRQYHDLKHMLIDHHERCDGSGYPNGMKNEDISFFGRIAGIVDSFDAMTSYRPYINTPPMSPSEAVNELYSLRGIKFQAELIEQFIQAVGIYPTGSLVELNTGEVGVIIEINSIRRLRPKLMLILDENKKAFESIKEVDLEIIDEEVKIKQGLPPGAYDIDLAEFFL